jgi:hypothetical protein
MMIDVWSRQTEMAHPIGIEQTLANPINEECQGLTCNLPGDHRAAKASLRGHGCCRPWFFACQGSKHDQGHL